VKPLGSDLRRVRLQPSGPWSRAVPLLRTGELQRSKFAATGRAGFPARAEPVRRVSAKRARENRERAKMADRRWPDRREGTVMCAVWEAIQPEWCDRFASDLHEIVRRGQGGSITDEKNTTPTCRTCNGLLSDGPEWGYRIGVIRHDALCCRGRKVCERYAGGAA
jgi:hypothetical protein